MSFRKGRRSFFPSVNQLEARCLLSLTPYWVGQSTAADYVGYDKYNVHPNDYQDIRIDLTGLASSAIHNVYISTGQNQGTWDYNIFTSYPIKIFRNGANASLYFDPQHDADAGIFYEIKVEYDNAPTETAYLNSTTAVDSNARVAGKQLSASWVDDATPQDWTGTTPSVGPDGYEDFHLQVSNLSAGSSFGSLSLATTTNGQTDRWEVMTNTDSDAAMNAELLHIASTAESISGDFYASPKRSLSSPQMTMMVTYTDSNRYGKTDTVTTTFAGKSIAANTSMPAVAEDNIPTVTATSLAQLPASNTGDSQIQLDATSLAALQPAQNKSSIQSAVLTNRQGIAWGYDSQVPDGGTLD